MIEIEYLEQVGVLKLNRGITNAINLELVNQLSNSLKKMKEDPAVRGIVLTSSNNKFFAIGLDIPGLIGLSREEFRTFYQSFNQFCLELYTIPKPTVAAITGHATAGGCILTLCCDYRFIAEGRKFVGLNEIKLGVPVPYPADCMLQHLIGTQIARQITWYGEFYQPDALLEMGMVDEVLPQEQLLAKAVEKAKQLGELPREAFAEIKRNQVEVVEERVRKNLADKEQFFIECWFSEKTRERLNEAAKKF
ncbi:MAG: enoyl-CoA hydratase/isomerase family protein [Candidatus Odinarchaeota archaeon]